MRHSCDLRLSRTRRLSVMIALALAMTGCQDGGADNAEDSVADTNANSKTITAALSNNADLAISARLVGIAQLGEALDGKGSYTVFLPVDDAWNSLDSTEREAIESAENRPQLIAVLRQHIAPGFVLASDLEQGFSKKDGAITLSTMGSTPITLHRDGEAITLGQGKDPPRIIGAPIVAGNDVVYRIDRLIPPPS